METTDQEVNQVKKPHPVKLRAVEITLSDGQIVMVHEPRMSEMGAFMRALPALTSLTQAFTAANEAAGGIQGMQVDIADSVYEGIFPLIAMMADMDEAEFKDLPLFDGMALMRGLTVFAPKNPQAATTSTLTSTP
jgi:hypothetical protein